MNIFDEVRRLEESLDAKLHEVRRDAALAVSLGVSLTSAVLFINPRIPIGTIYLWALACAIMLYGCVSVVRGCLVLYIAQWTAAIKQRRWLCARETAETRHRIRQTSSLHAINDDKLYWLLAYYKVAIGVCAMCGYGVLVVASDPEILWTSNLGLSLFCLWVIRLHFFALCLIRMVMRDCYKASATLLATTRQVSIETVEQVIAKQSSAVHNGLRKRRVLIVGASIAFGAIAFLVLVEDSRGAHTTGPMLAAMSAISVLLNSLYAHAYHLRLVLAFRDATDTLKPPKQPKGGSAHDSRRQRAA